MSDSISHDESSLVVIVQDTPLADSRIVAQELGIDHRSFFQMIRQYREEVETDFGPLQFKIAVKKGDRGGAQPQYALLTEDQSYVFLAYSKNTEQARACKRLLVKAFRDARQALATHAPQVVIEVPFLNHTWTQRALIFNQRTHIPKGYWCIFNEIGHICWQEELKGIHLTEESTPDISVGQLWCRYAREELGLDTTNLPKYPHHYPPSDPRGEFPRPANIYPNSWLGEFRTWFQSIYLEHRWPEYLKKHQLLENGEIAGPIQTKRLHPGKP